MACSATSCDAGEYGTPCPVGATCLRDLPPPFVARTALDVLGGAGALVMEGASTTAELDAYETAAAEFLHDFECACGHMASQHHHVTSTCLAGSRPCGCEFARPRALL